MSEKVNEKAKYTFTGCMFLGMGVGFFSMLIFKD